MGEVGVHWEASAPPTSPQAAAIQWEVIRAYHKARGYADIAYNFGFDDFGQTHVGRGWEKDTAANGPGHNKGNRAICWLGGPGYSPTPDAYAAASRLVQDGIGRGFTAIHPHSFYVATACPGDDLRAWVARQGWTGSSGSDEEAELGAALDTIGQWEQDTRTQIIAQIGQFLGEQEGRIVTRVNQHTDDKLAGIEVVDGDGGGLSEADVRRIVREELDRTRLGV